MIISESIFHVLMKEKVDISPNSYDTSDSVLKRAYS